VTETTYDRVLEVKLLDKNPALRNLALHAGLALTERREHSGPNGGPIPIAAHATVATYRMPENGRDQGSEPPSE
jgi:hypothetical protein